MKDYVVESIDRTGVKLLDTRTIEEYSGQLTSAPGTPQPDIYRKGRIPGAVHVPWDDAASADGAFKPVDELRQMYADAGVEAADEVIAYCRLGVRASYAWFVLKYALGFEQARTYGRILDRVGQLCRPSHRDRRLKTRKSPRTRPIFIPSLSGRPLNNWSEWLLGDVLLMAAPFILRAPATIPVAITSFRRKAGISRPASDDVLMEIP